MPIRSKKGTVCSFGEGQLKCTCVKVLPEGIRHMEFHYQGIFLEVLDQLGQMPFRPISKSSARTTMTIRPSTPRSLAAPLPRPRAFHFTPELFEKLQQKGIQIVDITLNIGLGTFRPVKVQDTKDHVMHSETFDVSKEAAAALNKAKAEHRRIIAVGTTSVRTLESEYARRVRSIRPKTKRPRFSSSRFHLSGGRRPDHELPFAQEHLGDARFGLHGAEVDLALLRGSHQAKYRFFSFGDAMFIYGNYDYSHNLED
jgi:S-adenosylmethionine:tRNA ribosyltransferase-isomerase